MPKPPHLPPFDTELHSQTLNEAKDLELVTKSRTGKTGSSPGASGVSVGLGQAEPEEITRTHPPPPTPHLTASHGIMELWNELLMKL